MNVVFRFFINTDQKKLLADFFQKVAIGSVMVGLYQSNSLGLLVAFMFLAIGVYFLKGENNGNNV